MLAPGASPTASVTGTAPNQVLHLGIPVDESYTDEQIAALKGGAPSGRDTLSELSDAIDGVAADLASLDGTKLDKAGGTLTGPLTLSADPTLALQAATKQYVDQIVASQDAMVFKGVVDCSANPNYRPPIAAGLIASPLPAGSVAAAPRRRGRGHPAVPDGCHRFRHAGGGRRELERHPDQYRRRGHADRDADAHQQDADLADDHHADRPGQGRCRPRQCRQHLRREQAGLDGPADGLNGKVGTSGGQTIAGDLILLATNAWRYLQIRADAGQRRRLAWNSGANARWTLEANDSAEVGASAGSDLEIRRYDDSGGDLGPAWQFVRATGDLVPGGDAGAALGRSDRRVGKAFLALADHADDARPRSVGSRSASSIAPAARSKSAWPNDWARYVRASIQRAPPCCIPL